jgi:GNAT superfamily N-acetyltransferase
MSFAIRKVSEGTHGELLLSLDRKLFPHSPRIDLGKSLWWIVNSGPVAIGFAGITLSKRFKNAYLCRAGVLEDFRGRGLHKRLLRVRIKEARLIGMETVTTDVASWNIVSANNVISCGLRLYLPKRADPGFLFFKRKL